MNPFFRYGSSRCCEVETSIRKQNLCQICTPERAFTQLVKPGGIEIESDKHPCDAGFDADSKAMTKRDVHPEKHVAQSAVDGRLCRENEGRDKQHRRCQRRARS
jgi:hypothetical protein